MRKLGFESDSNIGYLAVLSNDYAIVGEETKVPKSFLKDAGIKDIIRTRILGTNLPGLFMFNNGKEYFVSDYIFDNEEDVLKEFGIKIKKINTKHTALNNNLLKTNKHFYSHPKFDKKLVEEMKLEPLKLEYTNLVGGMAFKHNQQLLLSMALNDDEVKKFQTKNDEIIGLGTINGGVTNLKSGLLVNDNEVFVGKNTTGPEMMRIEEVLWNKK